MQSRKYIAEFCITHLLDIHVCYISWTNEYPYVKRKLFHLSPYKHNVYGQQNVKVIYCIVTINDPQIHPNIYTNISQSSKLLGILLAKIGCIWREYYICVGNTSMIMKHIGIGVVWYNICRTHLSQRYDQHGKSYIQYTNKKNCSSKNISLFSNILLQESLD